MVVSKDLENLTSCGLAFEYLLYPLEWLHTFVPIVPDHIDMHLFYQPFPFIYGIHTCIYEKLNKSQLDNAIILLVDDRQIINPYKDQLPENITNFLYKRLKFFQDSDNNGMSSSGGIGSGGGVSSGNQMSMYGLEAQTNKSNSNIEKYDLLRTGPIKAFMDAVLIVIDDYREYLIYDQNTNEFKLNEVVYFQMKDVYDESSASNEHQNPNKYRSNENEFYHEFRITQAFEEVCIYFIFWGCM